MANRKTGKMAPGEMYSGDHQFTNIFVEFIRQLATEIAWTSSSHVDYGTTDASESPMSMQGSVTKAYWLRIGDGVWWVHISSASHFPRRNIMCRNGHGVHGPRVGEFAA